MKSLETVATRVVTGTSPWTVLFSTSDYMFQSPLGSNCLSHSGAHKHLKTKHDIVGQQPGPAAAKHNAAAARLVVEVEGTQIGAPQVKNLNIVLLLITDCLPFVQVESPHFRILADVNTSSTSSRFCTSFLSFLSFSSWR